MKLIYFNDTGRKVKILPATFSGDHTMAYFMYSREISVATIQEQLRHAKLATTIHYLPPGAELTKILEMNANNQVK